VFPVRYELKFSILCRRNSVFKALKLVYKFPLLDLKTKLCKEDDVSIHSFRCLRKLQNLMKIKTNKIYRILCLKNESQNCLANNKQTN
jgi:hypothetical protein